MKNYYAILAVAEAILGTIGLVVGLRYFANQYSTGLTVFFMFIGIIVLLKQIHLSVLLSNFSRDEKEQLDKLSNSVNTLSKEISKIKENLNLDVEAADISAKNKELGEECKNDLHNA